MYGVFLDPGRFLAVSSKRGIGITNTTVLVAFSCGIANVCSIAKACVVRDEAAILLEEYGKITAILWCFKFLASLGFPPIRLRSTYVLI